MTAINNLLAEWQSAKFTEQSAINNRRQIEEAILSQVTLAPGTNKFEGSDVVIVTGEDKKWDQLRLAELAKEMGVNFPFKIEYKEDSKGVKYVQKNLPAVWMQLLDALTLKPKKPAFSVRIGKGMEDEEAA